MKKTLGIVGGVLLGIYLIGVAFFSIYTLPHTVLNGRPVGLRAKNELFDTDFRDEIVRVEGRNQKSDTFSAQAIQLSESYPEGAHLKQTPFLWPLSFFRSTVEEVPAKTDYDDNKLTDIVMKSELLKDPKAPVDARVEKVDGKYEIRPEEEGDKLDPEKLKASIVEALSSHREKLTLDQEYEKPAVKKDDPVLQEKIQSLKEIEAQKITFPMGDETQVVEKEKLLSLYEDTPEGLRPNEEAVRELLVKIAIATDTFGTDRKFKPTGIDHEITVPGGIYGWQMNVEKTIPSVIALLSQRKSGEVEIAYNHEAMVHGKNDIGSTYVEVDLTRQHMWFYKDGKLVTETDVVTGNPNWDAETPVGVDMIWSREKDRPLEGIVPQTDTAYSRPVDFWMPINWKGVGIHDSNWRNQYGGGVYRSQGSYGCINTPRDKVEIIFNEAPVGTPVVVYKSGQ